MLAISDLDVSEDHCLYGEKQSGRMSADLWSHVDVALVGHGSMRSQHVRIEITSATTRE